MEIFDLTPKQQAAFNRLKKAYSDCEKAGIYFINNYGALSAVDHKNISDYSDNDDLINGTPVSIKEVGETINYITIANEWSDDEHFYGLTERGLRIYEE